MGGYLGGQMEILLARPGRLQVSGGTVPSVVDRMLKPEERRLEGHLQMSQ